MNLINLYLDIDGVILTSKNTKPSENSDELIKYITRNFSCFWLTTHCKGDKNSAINYLSKYFDSETLEILKKIEPTNWTTLKTEAINFDEHFFWLDDYPLIAEKNILLQNSCLESLIEVDLKRENELKKCN